MADLRRTYRSASSVVSLHGAGHISDLLGVVDLRGRDLRRACRRWDGFAWFGAILFAVALTAAVVTTAGALRQAAETGQWQEFFDTQILMIAVAAVQCCGPLMFVAAWPLARPASRQLAAATIAVAKTASAGDHTLAPVASDVLSMLDHLPASDRSSVQTSLRRVNGALATHSLLVGIVMLLCASGLAAVTIVAATNDPAVGSQQLLTSVFGASAIAATIFALVWLFDAMRLRRRVVVQADDLGMRWDQRFPRRRWVSAQWDEIHSVFVVDNPGGLRHRKACIVDAGTAALAFELTSGTPTRTDADAYQLVKLALARTRLPLLDLTALAEAVTSRRNSPDYRRGDNQFADRVLLASHPRVHLPRPVTPRRIALGVVLVFLPLALVPTSFLTGFAMQHVQEQGYAMLLAQARSHAPLYHDALSGPDADWHAHGPTSDDPDAYRFTNGMYVITPPPGVTPETAPFTELYAPGMYGDAVVEVTLRMASGGVPYESAGLALHALSGNTGDNLHFGINGDGSWGALDFANCPSIPAGPADSTCNLDSSDQASAIHHAAWAPNKLTAILRGSQVICFINDVFVGSVVDLGPQSGRLGFGVEGLGVPVAFSDFTIYAL